MLSYNSVGGKPSDSSTRVCRKNVSVAHACVCVWGGRKCACAPQLSLMDVLVSPNRAEIHRHGSSLRLPPQHVRLPDPAYGRRPWPHVRWQQGPHPVPGSPWHQQGPAYRKTRSHSSDSPLTSNSGLLNGLLHWDEANAFTSVLTAASPGQNVLFYCPIDSSHFA